MATAQPLSEHEAKEKGVAEFGSGSNLVSYIKDIWESFKTSRKPWEEIWEECWYNFLGEYQVGTRWKTESEGVGNRSKAFIKLTALKCNTAHSKIVDVMFSGGNNLPFDLEAIKAELFGLTLDEVKNAVEDARKGLKEHFKEIELEEIIDTAILEKTVLGTGVLKGPIVENRKKQQVSARTIGGVPVRDVDPDIQAYELSSYMETLPVIDHVPLWEYYVDVNAKTPADSIGEIHFQRMLPSNFRKLAYQGGYNKENVLEAARRTTSTDHDDTRYIQLADNYMGTQGDKDKRVSCLEFWGLVPVEHLKEVGCQLPEDVEDEDSIEALVVLGADGIILKACVNPIGRRPFHVCPYKKRPHVIYGTGVAESMRDSQKMINSAIRMIVDNKALSGNGMIGVNLDRINTKRTKNLKVYAGKTWYTKGNYSPKDAVDSIEFKDVTRGLRELMEMFERFADEETAIPKYTHGSEANFLNKTASGMSMLMTQANINLKTVMKNIDNYWIEPIVEAFYAWFLEMQPEKGIARIPMKVKASGCDSLIAKELKMENYMKFMQITSSPQDAIFMDRVKLMKNIARILETDDVMRTEDEITEIMSEMSSQARAPKDVREMVDLDRLYPLLTRNEQVQILTQLGIEPDVNQVMPMQATASGEGAAANGY